VVVRRFAQAADAIRRPVVAGAKRPRQQFIQADAASRLNSDVCAGHGEVEVLWPGLRRAEGKEKGKGVVARRGLKEAQSETAGR